MKIATLGPKGTFSHEASIKYENKASITFTNTIMDVFEAVSKKRADVGVVPIENSIAGSLGQTLDYLIKSGLRIKAEVVLPISHNLVGSGKINKIKALYVHPQTYEQCELFINRELSKAAIIETPSNGKSAENLAKSKDRTKAAIIPRFAVDMYKLKILKKSVQDNRFNVTRFFVIAKKDSKKTGYDRTTISIYPHVDRPGLLHEILGHFAKNKINLTKIESRPSKGKLGDYVFFIDFEGHKSDTHVAEAIKKLEGTAFVTILGSYQRKY